VQRKSFEEQSAVLISIRDEATTAGSTRLDAPKRTYTRFTAVITSTPMLIGFDFLASPGELNRQD